MNAGASTPAGANTQVENINEGMAGSALEMAMIKNNLAKQKAEVDLLAAQKRKADMESTVMSKDVPKADLVNELYNSVGKPAVEKLKK